MMEYNYFYPTKIGVLKIVEKDNYIIEISMPEKSVASADGKETKLLKESARQIEEYLDGKRKVFDLPLNPEGTVFQKKVWEVLKTIPYGETWSYKMVAEKVGNHKASRAVGMANNKNPIVIVIPCHRVIGSNGSLVGYGLGLPLKEKLLEIEKQKDWKLESCLLQMIDEDYKLFTMKLLPGIENIMGVRLPELRKIAKKIAKEDWQNFLETCPNHSFEEVMVQAMVIGAVKTSIEELFYFIRKFIPKIDNWSVCDSFCFGLKITYLQKEKMWDFIQDYFHSKQEFEIRFAIVMLIRFYMEEPYLQSIFHLLVSIKHQGYYVKMAVAWAIASCYTAFPEETHVFLIRNKDKLDDITYKKAVQKIRDSKKIELKMKTRLA